MYHFAVIQPNSRPPLFEPQVRSDICGPKSLLPYVELRLEVQEELETMEKNKMHGSHSGQSTLTLAFECAFFLVSPCPCYKPIMRRTQHKSRGMFLNTRLCFTKQAGTTTKQSSVAWGNGMQITCAKQLALALFKTDHTDWTKSKSNCWVLLR